MAFREDPEECQIIIKSDALRDCIQGGSHLLYVPSYRKYCLTELILVQCYLPTELTEALWAGSVQVEVSNRPMFMKVISLAPIFPFLHYSNCQPA